MAADLLRMGARAAVLKLGHRGSLVLTREGLIASIKPYKVDIVDTTAAGDAFTVAAPADGSGDGAHAYEFRALDGAGNASRSR